MLMRRSPLGRAVALIVLAVFSTQCASGIHTRQQLGQVIPADPSDEGPDLIAVNLLSGDRVTVSESYLTDTHLCGMVRGDTAQSVPWAASLDSVRSVEVLGEGPAGELETVDLVLNGIGLVGQALMCLWGLCP